MLEAFRNRPVLVSATQTTIRERGQRQRSWSLTEIRSTLVAIFHDGRRPPHSFERIWIDIELLEVDDSIKETGAGR